MLLQMLVAAGGHVDAAGRLHGCTDIPLAFRLALDNSKTGSKMGEWCLDELGRSGAWQGRPRCGAACGITAGSRPGCHRVRAGQPRCCTVAAKLAFPATPPSFPALAPFAAAVKFTGLGNLLRAASSDGNPQTKSWLALGRLPSGGYAAHMFAPNSPVSKAQQSAAYSWGQVAGAHCWGRGQAGQGTGLAHL